MDAKEGNSSYIQQVYRWAKVPHAIWYIIIPFLFLFLGVHHNLNFKELAAI